MVLVCLAIKVAIGNTKVEGFCKEELYGCPPNYKPYIIKETVYNESL